MKWPGGQGAKGNEGVTGQVTNQSGAIGYVELAYAAQNNLAVADLKNHAGKFVSPTLDAISAAAAAMGDKIPDDLRMSILDPDGDTSYPISSFTYVLLYQDQKDAAKGAAPGSTSSGGESTTGRRTPPVCTTRNCPPASSPVTRRS